MKKIHLRINILILLLIQSAISNSQTFIGDVELTTQAEVDSFAALGYTEITGSLFIGKTFPIWDLETRIGSNIIDLSNLTSLVSVNSLSVYNNQNLISLNGLNNITTINNSLTVNLNPNLTSTDGLNSLTTVDYITMYLNPNLTSISSLHNISDSIISLHINETNLTSLIGLENITNIEYLHITNIPNLESLNGLNNLNNVTYIHISYNPNLSSMHGLGNLSNIENDFFITNNHNLTSLDGLDQLSNIGELLFIHENNNLISLNGLDNLTHIGEDLSITNNPSLINYCSLNAESLNSSIFDISGNDFNPSYSNLINGFCVNCSYATINNSTSLLNGQITANQSGATYQWLNCSDGYSEIDNATNQSFTPIHTGYYAVQIKAYGCTDISNCVFVEVIEDIEPDYCTLTSNKNSFEWIEQVELGNNINNISYKESYGFGDYSDQILLVDTGDVVSVQLTPGYKRRAYVEYWRIWVDWNYDGDFDDANEKVFEQKGKNLRTGSFNVPANVNPNDLRLRVAMRWKRYAPSCGSFSNGEVEDYTIRVNGALGSSNIPAKLENELISELSENFVEISELEINPIAQGQPISGYIRTNRNSGINLDIINVLGQKITTVNLPITAEEMHFEIPSDNLIPGIYFLNIDSNNESIKIVIQ